MPLLKKAMGRYAGSEVLTVVGPEAYFHGSMTVRGSVRIEGEMQGDVSEAQEVVVGVGGRVRGNICAERVEVGGQVQGDLVCSAQLDIKAGGRITGNIRAPKLVIEDGAVFDGNCAMAGTPATEPPEPVIRE